MGIVFVAALRKRLWLASAAALVATIAGLASMSAASAAATTDCSAANTQLESSQSTESFQAAYAMYSKVLEGDHESPCAKAGLTAAGNILAAQRLQAAGLYTNIPKLISDAIAAYPNVQIPQVLLDGFAGADVVTGLYAAGLTAAGDEALKTLIQSNPSGAYPNGLSRQIRASRGFAVAAMLEKRGFHDDAVTAYQQTLMAFPDATPPAT